MHFAFGVGNWEAAEEYSVPGSIHTHDCTTGRTAHHGAPWCLQTAGVQASSFNFSYGFAVEAVVSMVCNCLEFGFGFALWATMMSDGRRSCP